MAGESEKHNPNAVASAGSDTASVEKTAGVSKIEGVTLAWSAKGLWIAWAGIMLLAVAVSLDSQTIYSFQPYATSTFGAHSLLATIGTVQNIMYAVTKPPVAKIADVFGYELPSGYCRFRKKMQKLTKIRIVVLRHSQSPSSSSPLDSFLRRSQTTLGPLRPRRYFMSPVRLVSSSCSRSLRRVS